MEYQGAKMLTVSKIIFTDPVIERLRGQNKELREENEKLAGKLEQQRLSSDAMLATLTVEFLGPHKLLEAIKTFKVFSFDTLCYCMHCSRVFQTPYRSSRYPGRICPIFVQLVTQLRNHHLSFRCLYHPDGSKVYENHTIPPEGFDPNSSAFPNESVAHQNAHIVFRETGNPYDFKYGLRLCDADTPFHPEIRKVNELIATLRSYHLDGTVVNPGDAGAAGDRP